MQVFTLHFDGSCGPKNPGGTAAYGYAISSTGLAEPIETGHGVIGTGPAMSNNLAEFTALAEGLLAFSKLLLVNPILKVYGDSKIVINIMSKTWRATSDKLYYPAYLRAAELLRRLRVKGVTVSFDHVYREQNQLCDDLSKAHQK
jgi:ribonuclease HI